MFITDLYQEKEHLQRIQNHHMDKLYATNNPSGILLCQKNKNRIRWRKRDLQGGKPVTVDLHKTEKQLAEKLAINLYRMICVQFIQWQIERVDKAIRRLYPKEQEEVAVNNLLTDQTLTALLRNLRYRPHVPADFVDSQSPYRPFILSHLHKEYSDIIEWYLGDYKHNSDHAEHLLFPVKLGFKVRSKSEVTIADRLYERGILFHYEERILLSEQENYPDFYIPITFREKYAWEHFGAMDNDYYLGRSRGKILTYLDNDWFPGINMIATYETRQNPLTIEQVDQEIRWLENRYRLAFPDLPPDESFSLYDLAAYVKSQRVG